MKNDDVMLIHDVIFGTYDRPHLVGVRTWFGLAGLKKKEREREREREVGGGGRILRETLVHNLAVLV